MEGLLIFNSLLVAISVYFIRDFHTDFKSLVKTVQTLKEKVTQLSNKVNIDTKEELSTKVDETEE